MIVTFDKPYLKELYTCGATTDKNFRFQPNVIKGYQKCIRYLLSARRIEDLFPINSLNYEVLSGSKQGISSVRATLQYRVEFSVTKNEENDGIIITVCNILDLSNHYK